MFFPVKSFAKISQKENARGEQRARANSFRNVNKCSQVLSETFTYLECVCLHMILQHRKAKEQNLAFCIVSLCCVNSIIYIWFSVPSDSTFHMLVLLIVSLFYFKMLIHTHKAYMKIAILICFYIKKFSNYVSET